MQGKVEICGVNTSKLKVLKNEETMELLRRTKQGDMEAREQLIAGNLRLVLSVIQKFANRGENVDDLFQVGCIGLIKAIDNFNIDLDVRFSTYGVPMIVGEIRRYLRDNSTLRVSRSMRDTAYRVLQTKEKFMAEHQREPSIDEIAKALDLKREDVVFALDAVLDPVSLYEPLYDHGGDTICVMDQVKDSKNTDESWLEHIALKEAMARLTSGSGTSLPCGFSRARPRWRSPPRWGSLRRRCPDWRKTPSIRSKRISDGPAGSDCLSPGRHGTMEGNTERERGPVCHELYAASVSRA